MTTKVFPPESTKRTAASVFVLALAVFQSTAIPAQSVRDSAGIRIVTSAKPSWTAAQQLRIAATPSLVIGNRDEEPYILNQVRGAFRLSDGRIVIADGGSNELRFYSASGDYLKKTGGKGDGPGEFRSVESMHLLAGDTIAVLHDRTAVSLFTSAGTFVRRTGGGTRAPDMRPTGSMKRVTLPRCP